nr:MAG TPA: hypothetical protein [Caudoviricetes sp.]
MQGPQTAGTGGTRERDRLRRTVWHRRRRKRAGSRRPCTVAGRTGARRRSAGDRRPCRRRPGQYTADNRRRRPGV